MKYSFVGVDWKSIGKGALVAVSGAALTYVTANIGEFHIPEVYLPIVTAGFGILANVIRKWAQE